MFIQDIVQRIGPFSPRFYLRYGFIRDKSPQKTKSTQTTQGAANGKTGIEKRPAPAKQTPQPCELLHAHARPGIFSEIGQA